ncbi:hypothetical protein FVE85_2106 [Porphyridium purpureum]|uniref:Uncharacterized protein n=1 Tax=Porphyridium purpureum TaxID=35688 RepID=A0A5J4YWM4_PORPP|nr:hypothetical protein FVE85_2106 [Porphyridium purpureum]|eukprot:POR5585..scf209_3
MRVLCVLLCLSDVAESRCSLACSKAHKEQLNCVAPKQTHKRALDAYRQLRKEYPDRLPYDEPRENVASASKLDSGLSLRPDPEISSADRPSQLRADQMTALNRNAEIQRCLESERIQAQIVSLLSMEDPYPTLENQIDHDPVFAFLADSILNALNRPSP